MLDFREKLGKEGLGEFPIITLTRADPFGIIESMDFSSYNIDQ